MNGTFIFYGFHNKILETSHVGLRTFKNHEQKQNHFYFRRNHRIELYKHHDYLIFHDFHNEFNISSISTIKFLEIRLLMGSFGSLKIIHRKKSFVILHETIEQIFQQTSWIFYFTWFTSDFIKLVPKIPDLTYVYIRFVQPLLLSI